MMHPPPPPRIRNLDCSRCCPSSPARGESRVVSSTRLTRTQGGGTTATNGGIRPFTLHCRRYLLRQDRHSSHRGQNERRPFTSVACYSSAGWGERLQLGVEATLESAATLTMVHCEAPVLVYVNAVVVVNDRLQVCERRARVRTAAFKLLAASCLLQRCVPVCGANPMFINPRWASKTAHSWQLLPTRTCSFAAGAYLMVS